VTMIVSFRIKLGAIKDYLQRNRSLAHSVSCWAMKFRVKEDHERRKSDVALKSWNDGLESKRVLSATKSWSLFSY